MESLCDHVHLALDEFQRDFEEGMFFPLNYWGPAPQDSLRIFAKEFRFLKFFYDCAFKWSDAAILVPNLESLGSKIETLIQQVGTKVMKVIPKKHKITFFRPTITVSVLNLISVSNLISVLTSSIAAIEDLKPEIRGLLSTLSSNPTFIYGAPLQIYAYWNNLVESTLIFYLLGWHTSSEELNQNLDHIVHFIKGLIDEGPANDDINVIMVHIGRIAISAAFVCFRAWLCLEDLNETASRFKDLREQTDLSSSEELVDMLLTLLQSYHGISNEVLVDRLVRIFAAEYYYSKASVGRTRRAVNEEMVLLLRHFINSPDDAQLFWADVRMLVMKSTSSKYNLSTNNHVVQTKLLLKICLIKNEMLLMKQIRTGEFVDSLKADLLKNSEILAAIYKQEVEISGDENVIQIMKLILEIDSDVSSSARNRTMVRNVCYKFLSKIMLTKAELFLEELIKENQTLVQLYKHKINTLLEGMELLALFMENQPDNRINTRIVEGIQTVFRELRSLFLLFPDDKIQEMMAQNVNLQVSDLHDKINVMMVDIKRIYLDITIFKFPATNKIRLVDSLLSNIKQLLISRHDSIIDVMQDIEEVAGNLNFLRPLLVRVEEQDIVVEELKAITMRCMALAHEMQYFIDKVLLGSTVAWKIKLWIYSLREDFRLVNRSAAEIYKNEAFDPGLHINSSTTMQMATLDSTPRVDQVVLRLKDQQDMIIDRLTLGTLRDIVSIVGMAGIGKTTLANEVYNNPRVVYHFHVRAWCNVSQKYKRRELLLVLLSHIIGLSDAILIMSDEDLELKLYQSLKQRRYLIVMDDLWDTGAWDELTKCFPNDGNGSRILITSRIHEVVKRVNPDSDPHHVRLLSDDESWDLIRMKIFQEGGCPAELIQVGKLIAHNCKGLALAVVAIAGLMKRSGRVQEVWNQIAESLMSQILDDPQTRCAHILGLSYKHLPDSLKECFLYLGAFEGGIDVPVRKLIWLWIAEGFIPKHVSKSFEDVAEDYLMDLVGRSLVIVAERRSLGGVKACRLHDLLLDMCQSIAMEDNFLNRVIRNEEHDASFNGLDYGVDPIPIDQSRRGVKYEDYRLSFFSKRKHFVSCKPSGPQVRSLLFFGMSDAYPRCPYDITFITSYFMLLKVLDLESINMGVSFPNDLELLVHLRYLTVCGDIDLVPSSISKLFKLQTFLIRGLKGRVVLPCTIWSMSSLRHLHLKSLALFDFGDGDQNDFPRLDKLVTLSMPFFYQEEDKTKIICRLPNIKKLSCNFAESPPNQSRESNSSLRLDSLAKLESLKILYSGKKALNPCQLYFPSNLKKLTLSNFRLPWDCISTIAKLQSLEVLKLLSRAFEGERWDMVEGEFSKLKLMKLEGLDFVEWNACDDHLPNLQVLVLHNCKQLQEMPPSFTCIPTLQLIEVKQCGKSLEESVRDIDVEGINVLIHSSNMEP